MKVKEAEALEKKAAKQAKSEAREKESQEAQQARETEALKKQRKRKKAGPFLRRRVYSMVTKIVSLPREIAHLFSKRAISLFIDDTDIRLLVVKGKRIKKYASEHLEKGLMKDGVILDPPKVSAKIKELFAQTGLKSRKRVTVCLTGLNCLTKIITIPSVSRSVLPEAVKRESERELPMPIDGIYLSWQVARRSTDEIKVFVLAQNRPVVDALVKTLKMAEIKLYVLDLAPLALSRLTDNRLSIIADIRVGEADIVVVEKGVPSIIRGIPFSHGESVEAKLAILIEELQRIIKFYSSKKATQHSDSSLSVYITGGLTSDRGLAEALSQRLRHNVVSLESPLVSPDNFDFENYMVNIGSIIGQINYGNGADYSVDVNLLPEIYRAKRPELAKLAAIPLGIIATALFLLIVSQTLNLVDRTAQLETQYNEASMAMVKQLEQRQAEQAEIEVLQENVDTSTQLIGNFTSAQAFFEGERTTINGVMELLEQDSNDLVHLNRLIYSRSVINLSGTAVDEEGVLAYIAELGLIYGPTQVKLTSMANSSDEVTFDIIVRTGGG